VRGMTETSSADVYQSSGHKRCGRGHRRDPDFQGGEELDWDTQKNARMRLLLTVRQRLEQSPIAKKTASSAK